MWKKDCRAVAEKALVRLQETKRSDGWGANFEHRYWLRVVEASSIDRIQDVAIYAILREVPADCDVIAVFESIYKRLASDMPNKVADVVLRYPISIDHGERAFPSRSFLVDGVAMKLMPWSEVADQIRREIQKDMPAATLSYLKPFYGVALEISATGLRGPTVAKCEQAYDVFRGIMEMTFNLRRFTWTFGGPPKPLAKFSAPCWYAVTINSHTSVWGFVGETVSPTLTPTSDAEIGKIFHNATPFAEWGEDNSIRRLLMDCVRLYGLGSEEKYPHQALVSWWQVAERLTCAEAVGGNTDKVCSRLASVCDRWNFSPVGLRVCLADIAQKRCAIVHDGDRRSASDEDVYFLKTVCEAHMEWVLSHLDWLETEQDLENYYSSHSKPEGYFNSMRKVGEKIADWRAKGQFP